MKMLTARALLLWLFLTGPAWSAGSIKIAVPLSLQPYFIAGSEKGLAYETVKAAFAVAGKEIAPVYVNDHDFRNALAKQPNIDCAGYQTNAEAEGWHAVEEIFPFHDHAITLAKNGFRIDSLTGLGDKNLIAYPGARQQLGAQFEEVISGNPMYREIHNHRAQVKLLLKNRVHAIIADRLLVDWYVRYLEKESGEQYELAYHALFPQAKLKFACRTKDLLQDYINGLDTLLRNDVLNNIRSTYLEREK